MWNSFEQSALHMQKDRVILSIVFYEEFCYFNGSSFLDLCDFDLFSLQWPS